jgi:hypothetical protein
MPDNTQHPGAPQREQAIVGILSLPADIWARRESQRRQQGVEPSSTGFIVQLLERLVHRPYHPRGKGIRSAHCEQDS